MSTYADIGFTDLTEYVKSEAAAFRAAEDLSDSDMIQLHVFQKILHFAVKEGFRADTRTIDRVLHGEDENAEYEDEEMGNYSDWHYMGELMEAMDQQIAKNELPEKTTHLYKTWLFESMNCDPEF